MPIARLAAAAALPLLVVAVVTCSGSSPVGVMIVPPETDNPASDGGAGPAIDGGGPSAVTDAPPATDGPIGGRRAIPASVLSRKAIAYSGYRVNQSPETKTYPSEGQIKEDLDLLLRGGWSFLRLYDCSPHAATVLKVIKDNALDVKVMSGIWISGGKADHEQENRDQIEACMALYAKYGDLVAAVSVGNETLDDWSSVRTPPADLAAYITEVRGRVSQPVATDEMYLPFTLATDGATSYADVLQVAEAVDFLSLHVYAFLDGPYDSWDWMQLSVPEGHGRAVAMMNAAMQYTRSSLDGVRTALASHGLEVPMIIGEIGWKTEPGTGQDAEPTEIYRAHPVNQKMFYDAVVSWVYGATKDASSPKAAFYFEAFDEPWKADDDHWGLFDVNRNAKYVLWSAFPDRKPAGAPAYTDDDAVYYRAGDGGAVVDAAQE